MHTEKFRKYRNPTMLNGSLCSRIVLDMQLPTPRYMPNCAGPFTSSNMSVAIIIMIVSILMIVIIMPLPHVANETPLCARQLAVVSSDEAQPHRPDDDGEKHAKTKMMV